MAVAFMVFCIIGTGFIAGCALPIAFDIHIVVGIANVLVWVGLTFGLCRGLAEEIRLACQEREHARRMAPISANEYGR